MAKVKLAAGWLSEAVETACGWAFCALAVYALLFVDLSGNGRLWDALRAVWADGAAPAAAPKFAVKTHRVTVRLSSEPEQPEDRMLALPFAPAHPDEVAVDVPDEDAGVAPAAPAAPPAPTAEWRKHLQGQLRTFTVYGEGDETSSASAAVSGPAAPKSGAAAPRRAPTPAAAVSAYRIAANAAVRPGIGDHVTHAGSNPADGVRNFRGRRK